MKIKALIHTVSSKADLYGNRYHFATVIDTKTGKELTFQTGTERNIIFEVKKMLGDEWGTIKETHADLTIREFNKIVKNMSYQNDDAIKNLLHVS